MVEVSCIQAGVDRLHPRRENSSENMTPEEIKSIIEMLNDDTRLWDLDAGDWLAYVEELLDEVARLNTIISGLQGRDET